MFTKTILAAAVIAASTMAGTTASEARGICKDVHVAAVNKTGKPVKVIDMHYRISGYGKKSEPIRNTDVPKNRIYTITRNLEKANERKTQIEVLYRVRNKTRGLNQWSGIKRAKSTFQACKRGRAYDVTLKAK